MFCYQLACHLGARSGPWPEFERHPFTALAAALDHVEQDARQRGCHLFLMLNEYDRLDAALTAGTLTTKVLDELRHIIQHREYIAVLLSGSRPPWELSGAAWTDYLINVRTVEVEDDE